MPVAEAPKVLGPVGDLEPLIEADTLPRRILAVDDDSLVLMNTVIMLEDMGHTVQEASSAEEAIRLLELGPLPDVLITDHAMPHMTGAELARQVEVLYPSVAVIVASGDAELPDEGEGSVRRLQKPFSQRQLRESLSATAKG